MNEVLQNLAKIFSKSYYAKSKSRPLLPLSLLLLVLSVCTKSSFLHPGKSAIISADGGMYLRAEPNINSAKVYLVPTGKEVYVQSDGKPEELYGIKSKWYRVSYGRYAGWMWGGLAKSSSTQADVGSNVNHDPIKE